MSDILERLQDFDNHGITSSDRYHLRKEAYDEIYRLRADNAYFEHMALEDKATIAAKDARIALQALDHQATIDRACLAEATSKAKDARIAELEAYLDTSIQVMNEERARAERAEAERDAVLEEQCAACKATRRNRAALNPSPAGREG